MRYLAKWTWNKFWWRKRANKTETKMTPAKKWRILYLLVAIDNMTSVTYNFWHSFWILTGTPLKTVFKKIFLIWQSCICCFSLQRLDHPVFLILNLFIYYTFWSFVWYSRMEKSLAFFSWTSQTPSSWTYNWRKNFIDAGSRRSLYWKYCIHSKS